MNRLGVYAAALGFGMLCTLKATVSAQAECGWRLFPTVNPQPSGNQLNGVSGTAMDDVWMTGAAYHTHRSVGYALHWNGKTWTVFPQPNPTRDGGQLSGVVALAKKDVWTVGQQYAAPNYSARQAVANHWNGASFSVTPLPRIAGQETFLYGVTKITQQDIWSVGGSLAAGGLQQTYVVHWDGTTWTQVAAPNVPGAATNLDAVSATAATDVWSVGGSRTTTSAPFRTLAEHWDGTRWSIVPTPNVNAASNVFNAVVALAPNDVWAVGDYYNGKAFSPLAAHWNGTAWRIVPTPNSGTRTVLMYGAAAGSAHDVWAVGEKAKQQGAVISYILHWDGNRWAESPSPNVPHRLVTLLNAVTTLEGGTVWAVGGTANTKIVIDTVSEVRTCRKE